MPRPVRSKKHHIPQSEGGNGYGSRYIATSLEGDPNFTVLASAYGIPSESIKASEEIDGAIERLLSANGPFVLECVVDPEESSI